MPRMAVPWRRMPGLVEITSNRLLQKRAGFISRTPASCSGLTTNLHEWLNRPALVSYLDGGFLQAVHALILPSQNRSGLDLAGWIALWEGSSELAGILRILGRMGKARFKERRHGSGRSCAGLSRVRHGHQGIATPGTGCPGTWSKTIKRFGRT